MNSSERHLRDELARAADEIQHRTIRPDELREHTSHRPRVALLAAAAAVVAIAAPIAVLELTSSPGPKTPVAGSTSPTPSTTSPSPTYAPVGRVVLDPAHASSDVPPRIPVGLRNTIDGLPLDLAKGERLVSFAAHGSGWIVLAADNEGELNVRIVGADGQVEGEPWTTQSWSIASGFDGSVAFIDRQGDLELDGPDGTLVRTWDMTGRPPLQPSGILADGSVALREQDERQQAWLANPDGSLTQVDGLLTVGGVSPDNLVSGVVSLTDAGSCGIVRDLSTGASLWRTCENTIGHFSPDSRLVIGKPAYLDGIGDSSVSILDATTGQVLVDFETQRKPWGYISDTVWEDDTHLLTTYYSSEGGWSVLRLGVDGSVTVTGLGDLGGGELNRPLTFPAAR